MKVMILPFSDYCLLTQNSSVACLWKSSAILLLPVFLRFGSADYLSGDFFTGTFKHQSFKTKHS